MKFLISFLVICVFVRANGFQKVVGGISGQGITTRYWDCCKPSCAWKENIQTETPVASCAADGVTVVSPSVQSSCDEDGSAYTCSNQQPWAVNDSLAYGFVAASFTGGADYSRCCICLKMQFTSGALSGKTMIVQNTNTGPVLAQNQFDIEMPGGGVGIFTRGCHAQWNAPWAGWGEQYGGISSDSECSELPEGIQAGCHFRFGWFANVDNPNVQFEQITCPTELTSITGCSA